MDMVAMVQSHSLVFGKLLGRAFFWVSSSGLIYLEMQGSSSTSQGLQTEEEDVGHLEANTACSKVAEVIIDEYLAVESGGVLQGPQGRGVMCL